MTMEVVSLGEGVLTWDSCERQTDRYGTVYLMDDGHNSLTAAPSPSIIDEGSARSNVGRKGKLVAVVKKTRDSTHIGDLFRNIFPRTPKKGAKLTLGEGTLFTDAASHGGVIVGLEPDDGRQSDWLDPRALYDAHEQTVELLFYPEVRKQ